MADRPAADPAPNAARPPLGSWPRVYALCVALALLVMMLLYWLASHYNVRLPR